jgi:hypothetical protein
MENAMRFIVICSTRSWKVVDDFGNDCYSIVNDFASLPADDNDCACPADGLSLPPAASSADEDLLRSVRLFLEPIDDEYWVGYSPFV